MVDRHAGPAVTLINPFIFGGGGGGGGGPVSVATESFNKADSATLGPDQSWTEMGGSIDIVSNTAEVQTSGAEMLARMDANLGSANHYIEAVISQAPASFGTNHSNAGLIVRKDNTASTNYYMAEIAYGSSPNQNITIYKCTGGTYTTLVNGTLGSAPAVPYTLRLEVEGTALRFKLNGATILSTTDATWATGNYVGLRSYRQTATKVRYDSIDAGIFT